MDDNTNQLLIYLLGEFIILLRWIKKLPSISVSYLIKINKMEEDAESVIYLLKEMGHDSIQ